MKIDSKFCIFLLLSNLLFVSCTQYNKVYNRGTLEERYAYANTMYKQEKYKKAVALYELIDPYFVGKPQSEVILYRLADASFKEEDYVSSVHYYETFIKRFPNSTEIGNAQYKIAESYFELSPKHSVTQEETQRALEAFQSFIDNNPSSDKIVLANERIEELNFKLEKKAFEIAKQYYKIGYYKAAIKAFDNVTLDFLGTSLKEEAMFYKFKSAYQLGVNSISRKKEERVITAIKIYDRYSKLYPNSEFKNQADQLYQELTELINKKENNS